MVERKQPARLNSDGQAKTTADHLVSSVVDGPKKTANEWASEIAATWQKAVESILQTGRLLAEAKAALRHGEWGPMVEKLPFGRDTADDLIKISENPVLTNSEFIRKLPPSWGTLYEMTKLPEKELELLITAGKIDSETRRADVVEMRKAIRDEGLYLYERVPQALEVIIKFMRKWPDGAAFAENFNTVATEEEESWHLLDDLPRAAEWIVALHGALAEERRQTEREEQEEDEKRRAAEEVERAEISERVAAMSDSEVRSLVKNKYTPMAERGIAVAEMNRRGLPVPPRNKKQKIRRRRPPTRFAPRNVRGEAQPEEAADA